MNYKSKINIYIVLISFLTLALVVFLIHPVILDIQKKSQNLMSQKESLLAIDIKMNNLKNFKASLSDINVSSAKVDQLFINDKAPVNFVRFLEKSAMEANIVMEISANQTSQSLKKTTWPMLSFQIKTFSSFPNFLEFLEKIEFSPYLIEIQSLNIKYITAGELGEQGLEMFSSKDVSVNLIIRVFTNKQ